MKDHICSERHPEADILRCWVREGHEGDHMTVMPNRDRELLTRPEAVYW